MDSMVETKCPNPTCGAYFYRCTDQAGVSWQVEMERVSECVHCGVELEELFTAVAKYRQAREAYLAADESSDAAFKRYFTKLTNGVPTNSAQASRLADATNYASADLSAAEGYVWRCDVDPRDVDHAEGVTALDARAV